MSYSKTPPGFDYYTISRVLGEGGMGLVYLAHDRRTGLPVAIKVMSKRVFDPSLQARFLKENRILSALNHRNIVRCYEITQSKEGIPSIVMEYVDGVDIRAFEGRPYPELLPLMIQALMGLTYLRSQNVIHRDLSSNNVFVTLENRKRVTKILDFGVAKLLQEQDTDADVKTQTGQFLGKFAFASPELFFSSQVDWRSDVYSLGVIFHRLLTRTPPIKVGRSANYFEWLMAHQVEHHYEVEAPAGAPPLPRELAGVVRRMLARKPDDRPQSYEEIIDVLHAAQLEVPAHLEPDPLAVETLPPPVAAPLGSSGSGGTSRTPSSPSVSKRDPDTVPPAPPEAPLPEEESQQKRWPDLEETIETTSPRPPSPPAAPVGQLEPSPSPGLTKKAEMVPSQDPEKPPEIPVWIGGAAKGPPTEPVSSTSDLVQDKTERFDDVLAKLRQESALRASPQAPPPSPPPSLPPSPPSSPPLSPPPSLPVPAERLPEVGGSGGSGERKAAASPAPGGRRLVIYGEPPPPAAAPPVVARPVAAPPVGQRPAPAPTPVAKPTVSAPLPDAGRRLPRWIGIGLIVAVIVLLFVAVLWGLISLLRGAASGGTPRSSLTVPPRVAAATLPCPDPKSTSKERP